jgi:vesicle-fusing ATPase
LDRWVGGSEKLVRDLFRDAEAELQVCNGDLVKSGLHVIVIDEIDAVFRKRSSASDSGEVTRASAVNQILAKMDGVKALGNILVIGTTNRKELLDKALLRPGRLEVQMEIPLPDTKGRREILGIHLNALRRRGRLSEPLLQSFDDLAKKTKGYSGADIQGLVRCAGSLALVRARRDGSGIEGLLITLEDMLNAITELKR